MALLLPSVVNRNIPVSRMTHRDDGIDLGVCDFHTASRSLVFPLSFFKETCVRLCMTPRAACHLSGLSERLDHDAGVRFCG